MLAGYQKGLQCKDPTSFQTSSASIAPVIASPRVTAASYC